MNHYLNFIHNKMHEYSLFTDSDILKTTRRLIYEHMTDGTIELNSKIIKTSSYLSKTLLRVLTAARSASLTDDHQL